MTSHMSRWKVAGASLNLNGITLNWYRPNQQTKAVFPWLSLSIWTCQYPPWRSKVVNTPAPANDPNIIMYGKGWHLWNAFPFLWSTQNLGFGSGMLGTKTTRAANREVCCSMISVTNISSTCPLMT